MFHIVTSHSFKFGLQLIELYFAVVNFFVKIMEKPVNVKKRKNASTLTG